MRQRTKVLLSALTAFMLLAFYMLLPSINKDFEYKSEVNNESTVKHLSDTYTAVNTPHGSNSSKVTNKKSAQNTAVCSEEITNEISNYTSILTYEAIRKNRAKYFKSKFGNKVFDLKTTNELKRTPRDNEALKSASTPEFVYYVSSGMFNEAVNYLYENSNQNWINAVGLSLSLSPNIPIKFIESLIDISYAINFYDLYMLTAIKAPIYIIQRAEQKSISSLSDVNISFKSDLNTLASLSLEKSSIKHFVYWYEKGIPFINTEVNFPVYGKIIKGSGSTDEKLNMIKFMSENFNIIPSEKELNTLRSELNDNYAKEIFQEQITNHDYLEIFLSVKDKREILNLVINKYGLCSYIEIPLTTIALESLNDELHPNSNEMAKVAEKTGYTRFNDENVGHINKLLFYSNKKQWRAGLEYALGIDDEVTRYGLLSFIAENYILLGATEDILEESILRGGKLGQNYLFELVSSNVSLDILKLFIKYGIEMNSVLEEGSILHYAAKNKININVVEQLVLGGATNLRDKQGLLAEDYARNNGIDYHREFISVIYK